MNSTMIAASSPDDENAAVQLLLKDTRFLRHVRPFLRECDATPIGTDRYSRRVERYHRVEAELDKNSNKSPR